MTSNSEKERVEGSEGIIEGNRLIAKFCGHKLFAGQVRFVYSPNGASIQGCNQSSLQYHTSWDWQIPAYSKAMKQLKELAVKSSEAHEYYFKALENYESAVFNNDPNAGFTALVEAIKYHSQLKNK